MNKGKGKHKRIGFVIAAVIIFTAFCFSGCKNEYDPRFKNVILISLDTLRADHVGCYGYTFPTTPRIDAFAKGAANFDTAYATAPWTLPSHGSIFTGMYPLIHKADTINSPMASFPPTLAEVLAENGYKTAAVVAAPFLTKRYKLDRGFHYYDQTMADQRDNKTAKLAGKTTRKGLKYIDKMKGSPFFLMLHYWDIHHPYNPKEEYLNIFDPDYQGTVDGFNIKDRLDFVPGMPPRDLRHMIALYDGEIRYTDDGVGAFLDGLAQRGLDKNTLVIITSDHGEEFLDHGGRAHLAQCWDETIKVPLIIKAPWAKVYKEKLDAPVSLVDLFPTIIELLGLEHNSEWIDGLSLAGYMTKGTGLPDRNIFAETKLGRVTEFRKGRKSSWAVMITSDLRKSHVYKHMKFGFRKFFDLRTDPSEQNDLFSIDKEAKLFSEKLDQSRKEMIRRRLKMRRAAGEVEKIELDSNFKDKLKSLGYIE